ncbi:15831_t:CDS:2 [Acaulospora colombiana]|uniref:15831_t:CDS:1 n=1 Tax=Acaulospora colombiana TaxID=27376 RepID=A0ACA9KXY6_9GLOM|nr:15831_t:CDS:2 [Acaulospora colombiana]
MASTDNIDSMDHLLHRSVKRTRVMFQSGVADSSLLEDESQKFRLRIKLHDEYDEVKELPKALLAQQSGGQKRLAPTSEDNESNLTTNGDVGNMQIDTEHIPQITGGHPYPSTPGVTLTSDDATEGQISDSNIQKLIESLPPSHAQREAAKTSHGVVAIRQKAGINATPEATSGSLQCIHVLSGHSTTVADVKCQEADPQILTGSMDSTIRLWDLAAGKTLTTLTHHKKSVRALALHPSEFTFASGSADNIKQWKCPEGTFMQNFEGHRAIINALAVNADNVLFSGADNGSMVFWDWKSGYKFQSMETTVQPGSLESEAGIFACTFDRSGLRLITCEADKTIKIWREDPEAVSIC